MAMKEIFVSDWYSLYDLQQQHVTGFKGSMISGCKPEALLHLYFLPW